MRCGSRRPSTGSSITGRDDIFWCTADIGWITGHSYVVYGPLMNGATSVMFDGVPNYPDFGRFWETIDRLGVTIFYTAPTAIRALEREGDEWVTRHTAARCACSAPSASRSIPTHGSGIGASSAAAACPIVDTWWQTETGGILISPFPGATRLKPGSATKPLPGIHPLLLDPRHQMLDGAASGNLCIAQSWPGQMRTVWGDHDRFFQTYFTTYPGLYFTGDGCRRDEDGYYWITGRVDDVINVSGHRIGSAEVESSLVSHPLVAEAAVVGLPHEIKGQAIYAFVTLNAGEDGDDALAQGAQSPKCARTSAHWPRPSESSSPPRCPRPARARSCAASCARSRRARPAASATPRPSPTRGRRCAGRGAAVKRPRSALAGFLLAGAHARLSCPPTRRRARPDRLLHRP